MKTWLYSLQVRQRLHVGVGSGVGVIDMPIARETSTGIPYVPGSSLKGVLRSLTTNNVEEIFGPDTVNASKFAGAMQFSDAMLVALPVRSFAGLFALVTSPYLLKRYKQTLELCDTDTKLLHEIPLDLEEVCISGDSKLRLQIGTNSNVVFEDFKFNIQDANEHFAAWVTSIADYCGVDATFLNAHLCVVHDDIMEFLMNNLTEVLPGIRIKANTKTVETGALWYAEFLPSETILVGCVSAPSQSLGPNKVDDQKMLDEVFGGSTRNRTITIGGKTNTGAGICRLTVK
jgi:CRISPR-associated protein Cmr4